MAAYRRFVPGFFDFTATGCATPPGGQIEASPGEYVIWERTWTGEIPAEVTAATRGLEELVAKNPGNFAVVILATDSQAVEVYVKDAAGSGCVELNELRDLHPPGIVAVKPAAHSQATLLAAAESIVPADFEHTGARSAIPDFVKGIIYLGIPPKEATTAKSQAAVAEVSRRVAAAFGVKVVSGPLSSNEAEALN